MLVTRVSLAKAAELIEMPLRGLTQVGPRNLVLDGDPDPPRRRDNVGGCVPIKNH